MNENKVEVMELIEILGKRSTTFCTIATRSSMVNIGLVLVELYMMHTMTLSNIFEDLLIIFRCPSVMGSKLPGHMARLICLSPCCR